MAKIHGFAGEWARVRGTAFGLWPLFVDILAMGISIALMVFFSMICGLAIFIITVVAGFWCMANGLRKIERFFIGARGEEKVCGLLRNLPGQYHVFNDFVACGVHVDHVVVGPTGVYSLETKFWRGSVSVDEGMILVDGQLPDRDPLIQAKREATLVNNRLSQLGWRGNVTPVLVFASDTFDASIAEVRGAVVMNSSHLIQSFSSGRKIMDQNEIERLVALMENNR